MIMSNKTQTRDVEQMTVGELRAELSQRTTWAHDHDDRVTNGEIQHSRPLRLDEICPVATVLGATLGVVGGEIDRPQRLTRQAIGRDEETGPLQKDELVDIVEALRDERQEDTDEGRS